jgi:hypothetical protein
LKISVLQETGPEFVFLLIEIEVKKTPFFALSPALEPCREKRCQPQLDRYLPTSGITTGPANSPIDKNLTFIHSFHFLKLGRCLFTEV